MPSNWTADRKAAYTRKMMARQRNRCATCHEQMHRKEPTHRLYATIDHIIPLSAGGPDHICNMQVICRGCNQSKGPEVPADSFAASVDAVDLAPPPRITKRFTNKRKRIQKRNARHMGGGNR